MQKSQKYHHRYFRRITISLVIVLLAFVGIQAYSSHDQLEPHFIQPSNGWMTMNEAQTKASMTGKKIIVHMFIDESPGCQKMKGRVYADPRVNRTLDQYFYRVKINGASDREIIFNDKKMTMHEFAESLGVSAYPTTIFIDSQGEIISQQGGYMKPEIFRKLLSYVGTDAYKKMEFDQFTLKK